MEEILHQLICSLSHYLQGFIDPRRCRISSINSILGSHGEHPLFQSSFPLYLNLAQLARVITTTKPSQLLRLLPPEIWGATFGPEGLTELALEPWSHHHPTVQKVRKFSYQKPRKNTQHPNTPPRFIARALPDTCLDMAAEPGRDSGFEPGVVNRRGRIKAPLCHNSERRFHFARIVQLSH